MDHLIRLLNWDSVTKMVSIVSKKETRERVFPLKSLAQRVIGGRWPRMLTFGITGLIAARKAYIQSA
jgi:hypothetical protein